MLREILILKGKMQIFKRTYGEGISIQALSPILVSLIDFLKEAKEDTIEFMNIINFKIAYATEIEHNLLFIFITDLTDSRENIEQQLEIIRNEFFSRYESIVELQQDAAAYEGFIEVADEVFKELRPKIALVGFSGVGKTTITRLIRAEEIPMRHVPTITGDVATIKLGHVNLYLWDFAGQEKYSFVWNKFIKGADSVILVLDSSPKNVRESKFFIELIRKEEPHAKIAIVANKQDLPESMPSDDIEQYLGYKTYSMIAIDPDNRELMLNIIADTVKVRSLIAPFIKPLLERDNLIAEAEAAIMAGNIQLAAEKFDAIADLCVILGEEDLMQHFKSQAQFLHGKLSELQQGLQATPEQIQTTYKPAIPEEVSPPPLIKDTSEEDDIKKEREKMEKIMKEEEEKLKKEKEILKKEEEEKKIIEEEKKKEEERKRIEAEEKMREEEQRRIQVEAIKRREDEERRRMEEAAIVKEELEKEFKKEPKPVPKPVLKPVPKPVLKPIPKPVLKPIPKPIPRPVQKPAKLPEEVEKLNKEKENLNFKIKLLAKQYKKGELSENVFKNVLKKLENQLKELDEKIE